MAIEKVYPQLRCSTCGRELESTELETEHVFVLSVKPCQQCAAQQSVHTDAGDSAVSTSLVHASAESTSQTVTPPTQRG